MSTPTTLIAQRYRLVKMLGSGGMGVIWQAWDERLHRPVALKMLRAQPEIDDSERALATERAMREARITAGLHHPHAVTVFDVIEHEGRPCIVMQLVESTPLSALLKEHGPMTPSQAAKIGAEVASALAAAHKLRIVHRDVKPGNILITADGSALISDFGISHALGDATITATGLIHGTPAYLAPEAAKGLPTSFASDVFSLGSTIYTMLEGSPPFGTDANAISLLHKVARGGYDPPRNAGPLGALLKQMLATNPKRRPTMAAVAESLSHVERESSQPISDGVAVLTAMLHEDVPDRGPRDVTTEALSGPGMPPAVVADPEMPPAVVADPEMPPAVVADPGMPPAVVADPGMPPAVVADPGMPPAVDADPATTEAIGGTPALPGAAPAATTGAITEPPVLPGVAAAAADPHESQTAQTPGNGADRKDDPCRSAHPLRTAHRRDGARCSGDDRIPDGGDRAGSAHAPPYRPRPSPRPGRARRTGVAVPA